MVCTSGWSFETWLLAHSEGFDVEISDPKSRVIQIQGPASLNIMQDATGGQLTEAMKYYSSGFLILMDKSFMFLDQVLLVSWVTKFIVMVIKRIIWLFGII